MKLSEQERFWRHVVKGPADSDCWIWTGAVANDGYGRFWTQLPAGGQRAVRPQRYAYEKATGQQLDSATLLLHSCDVPICAHADANPLVSHVTPGTHRDNMIDRTQKGRHFRSGGLRFRGLPREERARRSRELRDAVRDHGWDEELIRRALNGIDADQPQLW